MAITREDPEQNRLCTAPSDSPVASSLLTEAALEVSPTSMPTWLSVTHDGCQDAWASDYGSLIWSPMIFHTKTARTTIHGYHRGFYLYPHINRGARDDPELILGLDRDGSCQGVTLRVPHSRAEHEFCVLWHREMLTGAYLPHWLPTEINSRHVLILAFAMNRAYETYAGCLPDERVVGCLREAVGLYDPACEYLQRVPINLASNGLHNPYLNRPRPCLQATDTANGPCATIDAMDTTYTTPLPDPYLSI